MSLAAVTGTDGKTSVASFTRQIWDDSGYRAASLGTLGIETAAGRRPKPLIDARMSAFPGLIQNIRESDNVSRIIFEALSASLAGQLYDAMDVTAAAFTTISPEHLDIHGSYYAYQKAKTRLFTHVLRGNGTAVINSESTFGRQIESVCHHRNITVIRYGRNGDLRICEANPHPEGTAVVITGLGRQLRTVLPFVGRFMVMNALAAAGIAYCTGVSIESIRELLPQLVVPPGRMQFVKSFRGASIYVDFAHTPGALRSALKALRTRCNRKLIVVFGCGGNRDTAKRPVMGQIAGQIADHIIVTDDNPRQEIAAAIRSSIMRGHPDSIEISSRREAINHAMELLQPGDVLLVAGRGDEQFQHVNFRSISGSDADWILTKRSPKTLIKALRNDFLKS